MSEARYIIVDVDKKNCQIVKYSPWDYRATAQSVNWYDALVWLVIDRNKVEYDGLESWSIVPSPLVR